MGGRVGRKEVGREAVWERGKEGGGEGSNVGAT